MKKIKKSKLTKEEISKNATIGRDLGNDEMMHPKFNRHSRKKNSAYNKKSPS
jgi:hypothetical protein